jgi:hypothetical protein
MESQNKILLERFEQLVANNQWFWGEDVKYAHHSRANIPKPFELIPKIKEVLSGQPFEPIDTQDPLFQNCRYLTRGMGDAKIGDVRNLDGNIYTYDAWFGILCLLSNGNQKYIDDQIKELKKTGGKWCCFRATWQDVRTRNYEKMVIVPTKIDEYKTWIESVLIISLEEAYNQMDRWFPENKRNYTGNGLPSNVFVPAGFVNV